MVIQLVIIFPLSHQIDVPLNQNNLVRLIPSLLIFDMEDTLTQFDIVETTLIEGKSSGVQVKLGFQRILLYCCGLKFLECLFTMYHLAAPGPIYLSKF